MIVHALIHTHEADVTVEVFASKKGAKNAFKHVLQTYYNEGREIDFNADDDSELQEITDGKATLRIEPQEVQE